MFRYTFTKEETFIIDFAEDGEVYNLTGRYASGKEARVQHQNAQQLTAKDIIEAAMMGHRWPMNLGIFSGSVFASPSKADDALLKQCVWCVESKGKWSDWRSGREILDEILERDYERDYEHDYEHDYEYDSEYDSEQHDYIEWILDRAIATNGESLKLDLKLTGIQLSLSHESFYNRT